MFCPKCGRKNDDGVKFCGGCGTELSSISVPTPTSTPSTSIPPVRSFRPTKPVRAPKVSSSEKSGKIKFTKDDAIRLALWLGLAATYVCISLVFIMIFSMEETISIKSTYNSSFKGLLTLENFVELLSMGNRLFNTTVLSKALSIGVEVFFYSVPVFAGLALASTIFSKKSFIFHVTSSVISFISSLLLILIVPLSVGLVPGFKTALATRISIVTEDMGKIAYTPFIIHAIAVVVLIILSTVFSVLLNNRRNKK